MRFFLFVQIFLLSILSFGQINQNGLPLIHNFTPDDYDASDQNWSVVQDQRGIMYFGNNDRGVLEFDGKTWRKIPVPGNVSVKSLAVDSLGTVYVGAIGDFGYLAPNETGSLEYKSLLDVVTDSIGYFSDVLRIHVFNGKVYFYNRAYLFIYDGNKVDVIDVNPERRYSNLYSFYLNNRYYIGSFVLGLRQFVDGKFVIAPNGQFFERTSIVGMIPDTDSTAIVVTISETTQNLYSYNQISGEVKLLDYNDNFYKRIFEKGIPYDATLINENTVGIGNIFSENYSFIQLDKKGKPLVVLSKESGLLDETVTGLYQSKLFGGSNPLWLPLNLGISRVDIQSPIRRFSEESGIRGGIQQIGQFNGKRVVFTMSGVFYQDIDENGFAYFKQVPEINTAVYSHLIFNDPNTGQERLLVGTITHGVYEIDRRFRARSISNNTEFEDIKHIAYALHQCKSDPRIVFIGMHGSFVAMSWDKDRWRNLGRIGEGKLNRRYTDILSVKPKELWLLTDINGVTRVRFGKDTIIEEFGLEKGLTSLKDIRAIAVDNKLYFATSTGVLVFNEGQNRFEPNTLPGLKNIINDRGVSRIVQFGNGYILSCFQPDGTSRWVEWITPVDEGEDKIERQAFRPLPLRSPDYLFVDNTNILWAGFSTDLYSFDPSFKRS